MSKSLVEDMARAMRATYADDWDTLGPTGKLGYLSDATAALSVLKDRLPADDRELVETLKRASEQEDVAAALQRTAQRDLAGQCPDDAAGIGKVADWSEKKAAHFRRAADRIIAYSASRDDPDEYKLLRDVEAAARELPRATPAAGSCSTEHPFTLPASAVWGNDLALKRLDKYRATKEQP